MLAIFFTLQAPKAWSDAQMSGGGGAQTSGGGGAQTSGGGGAQMPGGGVDGWALDY